MYTYKYGEFSDEQINETIKGLRGQIFFRLLLLDPDTRDNYPNINVDEAFDGLLHYMSGLNELLNYPSRLVKAMALIEEAWKVSKSEDFSYSVSRKLILEAGSEVGKIKEV